MQPPDTTHRSVNRTETAARLMSPRQGIPTAESLGHIADLSLALTLTGRLICHEVCIAVPGYEGPLRITTDTEATENDVVAHAVGMFAGLAASVEYMGEVDPLVVAIDQTPEGELFTDIRPDDIIAPSTNCVD